MTMNLVRTPGRHEATEQARAWTANQAERLGVSVEAIEATIQRGWLPDEIDAAASAAELLGSRTLSGMHCLPEGMSYLGSLAVPRSGAPPC